MAISDADLNEIERAILREIIGKAGDRATRALAILAAKCPPPLSKWFSGQRRQFIGLALDRALRGEIGADLASVAGWLSGLPFGTAVNATLLRVSREALPASQGGDALSAIGGYSGLDDEVEERSAVAVGLPGLPAVCAQLRQAGLIRQSETLVKELSLGLAKIGLTGDLGGTLTASIDRLAAITTGREAKNIGDHLGAALDQAERTAAAREAGQAPDATWGLPCLDALLPLRPGGLYVLAASPGAGKTSLALMAAAATAEAGGPSAVAAVSLEMTGGELATILAGRSLGISPGAIRRKSSRVSGEEWAQLRDLAETWRGQGHLYVADSAAADKTTTDSVGAWLRSRSQVGAGRLGLVIIDYLQLMESTDPRASEYDRITSATRALKRLAMALAVPVLVLSQLSRAGRTAGRDRDGAAQVRPEPGLEALRGSGSIEQDADAVLFLHRTLSDEEAAQAQASGRQLPVTAILAKNRAGPTGRVELMFSGAHQLFSPAIGTPTTATDADRRGRAVSEPVSAEDLFT